MMGEFRRRFLIPLVASILCFALGMILDVGVNAYLQNIIVFVCVNAILAMSLNLVNGITGQFSLGHAGFMATGAYVSAALSMKFVTGPEEQLLFPAFPIFAIAGGLAAAAAGWAVGLPSLRLKGDYLAIVTLGFGEIIRVVLLNLESVGGARGLPGIPSPEGFFLNFLHSSLWVVVTLVIIWRLMKSTYGRSFLSVREDEIAGEAMGVNTTRVKVLAFVISSFFAGVAGSLFAHYSKYLNPATFTFVKSIDAVIMVVLGGRGSLSGSILAAIIITVLPEALRPLQEVTGVDLRMVIYSFALIVLMLTRPQGLFASREITDLRKGHG